MDLFLERGYEETTISDIAAAIGMSSRSIFRYFDSKEDVVIGELVELGHEVAAALRSRPDDEDPWVALRHAVQVCVENLEDPDKGLRSATMLAATPALHTALLDKQLAWQQMLIPCIEARLDADGELATLQARALVSAALTTLDVAARAWVETEGKRSLREMTDAAFAAIRH